MNDNKYIFLDIDGVLSTDKEFMMSVVNFHKKKPYARELRIPYPFNNDCVKIFNEILEKTNSNIILTSTWRIIWDLDELDKIFKFNGVNKSPIDKTEQIKRKMSSSLSDDRQWEIKKYIENHNITKWVAIDDYNLKDLSPNFVQTNDIEGLKEKGIKKKIINLLNS